MIQMDCVQESPLRVLYCLWNAGEKKETKPHSEVNEGLISNIFVNKKKQVCVCYVDLTLCCRERNFSTSLITNRKQQPGFFNAAFPERYQLWLDYLRASSASTYAFCTASNFFCKLP